MLPDQIEDPTPIYLEAIEKELIRSVQRANEFGNTRLYEMLAYHMGWKDRSRGKELRGKRIRPLLVLLTCTSAGGDWRRALPAAAAVELVHNFSLIHDDIEDHSTLRRGRPTVWKKWGIPQAVNCGDAMFALAHLEAVRITNTVSPLIGMKAVELLQSTCLHLTHGQYLDLSYETMEEVSIDDYWSMVEGKTAALLSASAELGALSAFCDEPTCLLYRKFGHFLGLAFQVQDDLLGIWGDMRLTGKSSQSDLVTGKITLPVLYGLSKKAEFSKRWKKGKIPMDEIPEVIKLLEIEGGKEYTELQAEHLLGEAISTLEQAHPGGSTAKLLKNLAYCLVNRQT
ncbi:MAG TPA: polyprenyl synthetase family protein [Anaerolineales bacterium]|nr:polyprenyl synthetase family protein [Anaerolineales bacterium]